MLELIRTLKEDTLNKINNASDDQDVEIIRRDILGRKGTLQDLFMKLKSVPDDKRPEIGQELNVLKQCLTDAITLKKQSLLSESPEDKNTLDTTLPGSLHAFGVRHPLVQMELNLKNILVEMGFQIASGPEVELDYFNFEALNFPEHHPARDMQDSLYVETGALLRTHTSSVQIRVMQNHKPPLRFIAPGRVYRADDVDASHSPVFSQIEGLWVDKGVTFSDLKGTLQTMIRKLCHKDIKLRFRPSFFPFTEPSAEVDIECSICSGKGCGICKETGWLEVLGAGMVHPNVLRSVNIDPEVYTGLAFGLGIERFAMLFYNVNDMRLFYENDVRFLRQFYPEVIR